MNQIVDLNLCNYQIHVDDCVQMSQTAEQVKVLNKLDKQVLSKLNESS